MDKQKGYSKIILIGLIGIMLIVAVKFYKGLTANDNIISGEINKVRNIEEANTNFKIINRETVNLPSGATLKLENNLLYFSYGKDATREKLNFGKSIETYINGYKERLEVLTCKKEDGWFGDYSATVVTECELTIEHKNEEPPTLIPYNTTKLEFLSVQNKEKSRFRTLQQNPLISINVPYFQLAKSDTGNIVNVVSPKEDTVAIYTNYGRVNFQFNAEELENKQTKTLNIGPLSISLTPKELTCGGIYKKDYGCDKLLWKERETTTFNLVLFELEINELEHAEIYPILIDIEK